MAETYSLTAAHQGIQLDEATIAARLHRAFTQQELIDRDNGWRTDEVREADRWRSIVAETLGEVADSEACFTDLWNRYRQPEAWRAHPEAGVVLRELESRGFVLGMASNFDGRLAAIVQAIPEIAVLRPAASSVHW